MDKALITYSVTDVVIDKLKGQYEGLTIKDSSDKQGFDIVHSARTTVKGLRVAVEHRRKELNGDALEWTRATNAEAKRLTGLLTPIEGKLEAEEAEYNKARQEEKDEKERLKKALLQRRITELAEWDGQGFYEIHDLEQMPIEKYVELVKQVKAAFHAKKEAEEKEAARQADKEAVEQAYKEAQDAEIARLKAEADKVEAEREAERKQAEADRAAAQAVIDAERAELQADKDKIEADKRAVERAEEIRMAEAEAAEKAIKDERDRVEQENADIEALAQSIKEEVERQEALKPDKEKLHAFVNALLEMDTPEVVSEDAQVVADNITNELAELCLVAKELISKL